MFRGSVEMNQNAEAGVAGRPFILILQSGICDITDLWLVVASKFDTPALDSPLSPQRADFLVEQCSSDAHKAQIDQMDGFRLQG